MMTKYILATFLFLNIVSLKAQDSHLSLYDDAPLSLNPAMTGVIDGAWRVHGQYRTQWKSVNYKPYTSALISFDIPYKKWGFGMQVSNFRAGAGNYNVLQGSLSVAYTTSIDKKKNHNISFGLQGGMTQKTIEHQLLSFNNQYTTLNGGGFDESISNLEDLSGQSVMIPVTNAGFMYFFAKQESRLNPFLGFSAFNLIEPKESLYGFDNRLPRRYYAHIGTRINVTELLYLIPKVLVMNQKNFWEETYALDAGYYLKNSDFYLTAGVIFRSVGDLVNTFNQDAAVVSIGAKLENIVAKVAYDFNISSLSTASGGRGAFEVSLTYTQKKKKSTEEKICPRL